MPYVNRVTLEMNGQTFEDFESYSDQEETYAVTVELMNKTDFAEKLPRYGFTVVAKRPTTGFPFDLGAIKGGTASVGYPGGRRVTYGNVYTLSKGEGTVDGDTPLSESYVFGASSKTIINT